MARRCYGYAVGARAAKRRVLKDHQDVERAAAGARMPAVVIRVTCHTRQDVDVVMGAVRGLDVHVGLESGR